MDGEDDHVHLLVSFPPKYSVATLVNSLKGVSARLLRQRNFPEVRRKLWGTHFWTPSYFAATTGGAPQRSTMGAATGTPMAWPMNRQRANSAMPAPRASGAIWVPWVCSVLWNM